MTEETAATVKTGDGASSAAAPEAETKEEEVEMLCKIIEKLAV